MKLSRFNKFMNYKDNVLLFNSLSCGFAEISPELSGVLIKIGNKENLTSHEDRVFQDNYKDLIRGGILVEDNDDELKRLNLQCNMWKFDNSSLGLTIAPTTACNFSCVYCYETGIKPAVISLDIEDAIIEFIESQSKSKKLQNLGVTWYGGEPLLAFESIVRMAEKMIELSNKYSFGYDSSIITNGYLLERDVAEKLNELHVSTIQVTLDGPSAVHNKRRPLKNGGETFEKIITNIQNTADLFKNYTVRINTDSTNENEVVEVFLLLEKLGILNKLNPYLGRVHASSDACADLTSCVLDNSAFAQVEINLYKNLISKGFYRILPYPIVHIGYCSAIKYNTFVIDPLGRLYKCWDVIGIEEQSFGNIENLQSFNSNFVDWLSLQASQIPQCNSCDVFPICAGGCPYHYISNEYKKSGKPDCQQWKYSLDDYLILTYEARKLFNLNSPAEATTSK
jgi:uncharacterized protein